MIKLRKREICLLYTEMAFACGMCFSLKVKVLCFIRANTDYVFFFCHILSSCISACVCIAFKLKAILKGGYTGKI